GFMFSFICGKVRIKNNLIWHYPLVFIDHLTLSKPHMDETTHTMIEEMVLEKYERSVAHSIIWHLLTQFFFVYKHLVHIELCVEDFFANSKKLLGLGPSSPRQISVDMSYIAIGLSVISVELAMDPIIVWSLQSLSTTRLQLNCACKEAAATVPPSFTFT
ncbi:hypothetical protein ACJX0J_031706, partial [Zea mays]